MAFDKSEITQVVNEHSKELAVKAVASSKTAKLLISNGSVTTGVKGTMVINKMDSDVIFQDGTACGRTPLGDTNLSDKTITVKPLKINQNFCMKDLYGTYFAQLLAKGQNPETEVLDSSIINDIMTLQANKVASDVEKMLWRGDTALTGTNNLKWIDGILKQIAPAGTPAAGVVALSTTGADIQAKLVSAIASMPIEVSSADDFRIFMGQDTYNTYLATMASKNIFRPVDDLSVFGTVNKIEVVPGLNGTGDIVAARLSDLHLGVDLESDMDKAELRYSVETEQWYMDFHFAVGVSVIFPEQIGYASIS